MYYLADVATILLIALALVGASWGMADQRRTLLENTAIGVCAWLGAIALFFTVSGHAWGLHPYLWIFFLPLLVLGVARRGRLQQSGVAALGGIKRLGSIEQLLALYLLAVCGLTLFLSLAPPNANDYDSLVYHLAAPARYLMDGRITELAYDHHTYFPFALEMLFSAGLNGSGPVLAKLFHWLMLPLCLLTITAIGHRHFSLRAGLIAAVLFASIPIVLIEATTAYIDLGLTLFVAAAFLCFLNWLQTREFHWLAWCGAMCGFAFDIKYFGALFFGWLLLWAVGDMVKRKEFQLKPLLGFCLLTALLGGFYYVRNWIWVGNPVYPFAYEILGGKGWTLEMAKAYAHDQEAFGFGRGILDWLLLPFRASWSPLNFNQPFWPLSGLPLENNGALGRFEVPGHLIQTIVGPALLAFGAPVVFFKRKPRAVGFLLWSFLFFWVFWAATSQQLRYLIPTLALLGVACGWGIPRLQERGPLLKWTAGIALTAWLVFVPVLTAWRLRDAIPVALGQEAPEIYLTRTFAGYDAMDWASKNTGATATFAIYGEPRNFYLKRKYFWADDPHNNLVDYTQVVSGRALIDALKKLGATHILLNTRAAQNGGFGGPPPHFEDAMKSGLISEIYEARGYRVLRIN